MNIVCKIKALSLFYNFSITSIQLCRKIQTSPLLLTFTFGSVNEVGKKKKFFLSILIQISRVCFLSLLKGTYLFKSKSQ